jgi:hypothetical protein
VRLHLALRAIVSLPLGLFVTFFQAHGPDIGLIMLAAFAGAMALGNLAFLLSKQQTIADSVATLGYLPVLALSLFGLVQAEELFLALFVTGVALVGLLTAAFEGYRAKSLGLSTRDGRDFLISSLIALALGLMFLIATLDSVSAVGFFGAYLILYGVHWGIASATVQSK